MMCRLFKSTTLLLVIFSLLSGFSRAQEVYICVWTNPERTMTRIFPQAADYRTATKKISEQELKLIEARLGDKLLPGQRETYQYYKMLDSSGSAIGYIIAASQKGEFGAIEFVFGLDSDLKIKGMYIQRARERDREFRQAEFLEQFTEIHITDADTLAIGKDIVAQETVGTKAIVLGVKKELIAFDVLKGSAVD